VLVNGIAVLQVCTQVLSLPAGVLVNSASVAAGHLSSASIYPACFAPYLLTTACSDGHVHFWRCELTSPAEDVPLQYLKYVWKEWEMMIPKEANSSIRVQGTHIFKPSPPVGAGGGYMFSGRTSVPLSVRPCVCASIRDSRGSFMFPRYLQYLLTDFRQTFVTGASWDTDDQITFLGLKVKVQGHTIAAEAHSTRRYRRVQLFLVHTTKH